MNIFAAKCSALAGFQGSNYDVIILDTCNSLGNGRVKKKQSSEEFFLQIW